RDKVRFVRAEAARHGRDGAAIRISAVIFTAMLTDSPAATRGMAEGYGRLIGLEPEAGLCSPLALIGTPEECVAELPRRVGAREWGVNEFVFPYLGEETTRRVAEEVLARL